MSEQLTTILVSSTVILLIVIVWGATIAYVFWDTSRRHLAGWQQVAWLMVALLPVVGLAAYLFTRRLMRSEVDDPAESEAQSNKRVTFLKSPQAGSGERLPTIPAAAYIQEAKENKRKGGSPPGQSRTPGERKEQNVYILSVLEGPHVGQEFVIDQLPAYIGRGPGCTIRLDDDRGVSRRHAELYQQAGVLRLRDLESTHGTHVNGYDIDDKGLKPGDKIRVGYSLLLIKT